jgi:RNA polymerase sigma-70 factor (TIGR02943 family)
MNILNPTETIKNWVEQHSEKMYSWAIYKTKDKESAEDLVQDTFLAAFQSIGKFEGKSDPKTWLYAILNRKIAMHLRIVIRNTPFGEKELYTTDSTFLLESLFDQNDQWEKLERPEKWRDDDENLLDNDGFIKVLNACLVKLPEKWFSALQLKYLDEKKGVLICQELGIAPTNFWQILHRAKLQLRKCLDNHWFKA